MIQILKSEYKIGSKLYDHRTLTADFMKCVLQDKENPTIFFNRSEELNDEFTQFNKPQGKDYKKDPTELLMHIQEHVGEVYKSVWTALEAAGISETGTPEAFLKEAKYSNLKEFWNKNIKKEAEEESDFIMVARSNNKCKHCGKAHASDKCWKKFAHLRPKNNKGSLNSKKKMVCWICGGDHPKKECPKYKGNKESKESAMNGVFIGSVHFETNDKTSSTYADKVKGHDGEEVDYGSNAIRKSQIERAMQELKQLLLGQ